MRYIVVSEKYWNKKIVSDLYQSFPQDEFILIDSREAFTFDNINSIRPSKIFIPHWSYIIPKEIYESFECIVFHMTDLPYGRGGSPLQNLIIRGYKETVISALKVTAGLDTGDIYLKSPLLLYGSAEEIFIRANDVIGSMIKEIIKTQPVPSPQLGEVVIFKRRKPADSDMKDLSEIDGIYDHIRMLDAEGYPNAFIDNNGIRYSFRRVNRKSDGSLEADVIIRKIK